MKQINLNLYQGTHGGRRPGSGRKRQKSAGVSHRTRAQVSSKTPLHINFKYRASIRNKDTLKLLKRASPARALSSSCTQNCQGNQERSNVCAV